MPTRIEWCDETINPLGHWCFGPGSTIGNPNPCPYCYAKILAARNMRSCDKCKSFSEPHTHFEQLEKLIHWKKPRNIFVQSMGDLFHDEVPNEWIEEVFKACEAAPWHRYLFLTKNPERYFSFYGLCETFDFGPNNWWFGVSVTNQKMLVEACTHLCYVKSNIYLSIEPLHENLTINSDDISWVIVGAETGNRKGKIIPKREWIENIVEQCRAAGVPLFMKNSLEKIWGEPLIQEFPW